MKIKVSLEAHNRMCVGIGWNISLQTVIRVVHLSKCGRHSSEYHYNIVQKDFTKSAIALCHTFLLSQGNLRMSRNQFWFLLILRQKSAKNYPLRKPKFLSPQSCYIASQGGIWKIIAMRIFFYNIHFWQSALGKGLESVEVGI